MKFKRVFRGYDPREVDRHLVESSNKEQQIRTAQKERIDELVEENSALRKLVAQYQADEQAISRALIQSQNVAEQTRQQANEYSQMAIRRAKVFCASWQAYASTLVAALSDEEVRQLNGLQRKIENLLTEYNGNNAQEVAATQAGVYFNPIARVEGAAEQVIDLNELVAPSQSLEEICVELGIIKK